MILSASLSRSSAAVAVRGCPRYPSSAALRCSPMRSVVGADPARLARSSLFSGAATYHPSQQSWLRSPSRLGLPPQRAYHAPAFASLKDEIGDANRRYQSKIRVQPWSEDNEDEGWCVVSQTEYQTGDVVLDAAILEESGVRHSHTIQVDTDLHVFVDLPSRFVNHACGPDKTNLGVQIEPSDGAVPSVRFVALRHISKGDQLLWDYETTEDELDNQFDCCCDSQVCRKKIRGFRHHSDQVMNAVADRRYIAPHLLQLVGM